MTYQHLSHHERYQITALMKAGQNQTQIDTIPGRHKSTAIREIHRNTGLWGYRFRQVSQLADKRSQGSRNAKAVAPETLKQAFDLVGQQWSPEQVAARLPVSHETLYRHIYWDSAVGGSIWRGLTTMPSKLASLSTAGRRTAITHGRSHSTNNTG